MYFVKTKLNKYILQFAVFLFTFCINYTLYSDKSGTRFWVSEVWKWNGVLESNSVFFSFFFVKFFAIIDDFSKKSVLIQHSWRMKTVELWKHIKYGQHLSKNGEKAFSNYLFKPFFVDSCHPKFDCWYPIHHYSTV